MSLLELIVILLISCHYFIFGNIYYMRRFNILLAIFIMIFLSGCGRDVALIAKSEGFVSFNEIDIGEYKDGLAEYLAESKKVSNVKIDIVDSFLFNNKYKKAVEILKDGSWRRVIITDEPSSYREGKINNNKEAITLYYKDLSNGEVTPESVICYNGKCVNVTAQYVLADSEMLFYEGIFPDEVFGVLPQDIANIGRLSNLDSDNINYFIKSADEKVNISVISPDGNNLEYTEKDRVFIKGSKKSKIGNEVCYGYLNHINERLEADKGFFYICFNEKYKIFTSTNKNSYIEKISLNSNEVIDFKVDEDLYWNVPVEIKELYLGIGKISEQWHRYHSKK